MSMRLRRSEVCLGITIRAITIKKSTHIFPSKERGLISPYPTVEIVTMMKYTQSLYLYSVCSTSNSWMTAADKKIIVAENVMIFTIC